MIDLRTDPAAVRVVKLPVPVTVEFAARDGTLVTLEGAVDYHAGDALLTGAADDHWPVARARFLQRYEPIAPTQAGDNGTYRKLPQVVLARQLDSALTVPAGPSRRPLSGAAGDWLIQHELDEYGIVAAKIFAATYRPARSNE